jgi:hypothetical protein
VEPYVNNQVINSQPMNHQRFGGLADQGHSYNSLGQSNYGNCDSYDSETVKVICQITCFILIYASLALSSHLHVLDNQNLVISFKM